MIFAANKTGYAVCRWSDVVQTDHPMYSIFIVRRVRLTVYTSGVRIISIVILCSCTDTVEWSTFDMFNMYGLTNRSNDNHTYVPACMYA